ncbi:hypothetical protein CRG98_006194 [Punica granatum]|uniref:Uncharacterized protein n=1 Tax=Punica granatum TaxID=22663 RepID=A0A2I0KY79_PUNGR|nr:hypothetical protein CRG98_006194 [Punica granatum]
MHGGTHGQAWAQASACRRTRAGVRIINKRAGCGHACMHAEGRPGRTGVVRWSGDGIGSRLVAYSKLVVRIECRIVNISEKTDLMSPRLALFVGKCLGSIRDSKAIFAHFR